MRKVLFGVVLLAVATISSVSKAQEISFSSGIFSEFHTNHGFIPVKGPVSIDGLTLSYQGWRVGGYLIVGLEEKIEGGTGEIDLVVAYNCNVYLGDFLKEVNIDFGLAYFDFASPSLWTASGDFLQPFLEVRRLIAVGENNSIYPIFRFESPVAITNGISGTHTYLGVGHSWKILPKLSFSHDANILWDGGAYGLDSGPMLLYRAGLNWQISERISLCPSLKLTSPISGIKDRKTEISGGGSLNLNFKF